MKPEKGTGWRTAERSVLVPCCPKFFSHVVLEYVKDGTKNWLRSSTLDGFLEVVAGGEVVISNFKGGEDDPLSMFLETSFLKR